MRERESRGGEVAGNVQWSLNSLHSQHLNHEPHVGDALAYTGFPNGTDLLTITGRVSGYRGRWVIVQSYIWMGASGSGVFDSRGRLIGVVSMVEIGNFKFPQVIEDVGYIAKISEEDERKIREL